VGDLYSGYRNDEVRRRWSERGGDGRKTVETGPLVIPEPRKQIQRSVVPRDIVPSQGRAVN